MRRLTHSWRRHGWPLLLLAAVAAAPTGQVARAGDRRMNILTVNMTPDAASTEASRSCIARVQRKIAEEYTTPSRTGESALLQRVGRSDPREFMTWSTAVLAPLLEPQGGDYLDAVALIDCRPELRRVDVVVLSPSRGLAHIRLRDVAADARLAQWLGARIVRHGWNGFSP